MNLPTRLVVLLVASLCLFWSRAGQALCAGEGGVCTIISPITCGPNGDPPTWTSYCVGGAKDGVMSESSNCTTSGANECFCGAVDPDPGPCTGCAWQGPRAVGGCYHDDTCTVPCAGAPELGGMEFFSILRQLVAHWRG